MMRHGGCRAAVGARVGAPLAPVLATQTRGGFFDNLSEAVKRSAAAAKGSDSAPGSGSSSSGASPLPPGMDLHKLKTMQDLFNSQPPEKQAQLMQQAMEMQKTLSKIPGFKTMSKMNTQVLEQLVKQKQEAATSTAAATAAEQSSAASPRGTFSGTTAAHSARASATASSSATARVGAPTLDDLKKVNLGPEIEALFTELRTIRQTKNEYRDRYQTAHTALEAAKRDSATAAETEKSLRARLKKAEQEVMLLTSENIEVRDDAKQLKALTAQNARLTVELRELKSQSSGSNIVSSPQYRELQAALAAKEEAVRTLSRKVQRQRRRDPLLHFSLCCSDIARMCEQPPALGEAGDAGGATSVARLPPTAHEIAARMNGGSAGRSFLSEEPLREAAEESFTALQSAYAAVQQSAWVAAAAAPTEPSASESTFASSAPPAPHAAATAYITTLRRLFLSKVPFSNYDAIVTVRALKPDAFTNLRELLASAGFELRPFDATATGDAPAVSVAPPAAVGEERKWVVTARPGTTTRDILLLPGPYASCLALHATAGQLEERARPGSSARLAALLQGSHGAVSRLLQQLASFSVVHAQPVVSATLAHNAGRVEVSFESARASGPGGQAVNVAETQIKAKLFIDQNPSLAAGTLEPSALVASPGGSGDARVSTTGGGSSSSSHGSSASAGAAGREFAFYAESQDSRSALSNKADAVDKLFSSARKRFNDGPLRSVFGRCDDVERVLVASVVQPAGEVTLDDSLLQWCLEAAAAGAASTAAAPGPVTALDAALVVAVRKWVDAAQA